MRRVSRNEDLFGVHQRVLAAPRMRRVSRNREADLREADLWAAPRMRRVSRNGMFITRREILQPPRLA